MKTIIYLTLISLGASAAQVRFDQFNRGPGDVINIERITVTPLERPQSLSNQKVVCVKGIGLGLQTDIGHPGEVETMTVLGNDANFTLYQSPVVGLVFKAPGRINNIAVRFNFRIINSDGSVTNVANCSPQLWSSLSNGYETYSGDLSQTFTISGTQGDALNGNATLIDLPQWGFAPYYFLGPVLWSQFRPYNQPQVFYWGFTVVSLDYTPN